jgi:hypothetical protein
MLLALNMAKMAKEGFWCAAIDETKYLTKTPSAEVQDEKKRGVVFPGHKKVNTAILGHPAMLRQNQMSGCLPCQNGTAMNSQTGWKCNGTGAAPPPRRRERIPELTPPAPTGNTSGTQPADMVNMAAGYIYWHSALPCAGCFEDNGDTEHDTDFDPDMLTDEG